LVSPLSAGPARTIIVGGKLLKWFDYAKPGSVRDAVALLAEHGDGASVLAGGTDILVQMRVGAREPEWLVDVKAIPELNRVFFEPGAGLILGAAVPCYRICQDEEVQRNYPGLIDVASMIGGTQIQGRASIGGNLCNASPSADSIPILIALEAKCKIAGPDGEREVAAEDFCTSPGQTVLGPGEILVSLEIPLPRPNAGAHYMRFTPRNEMDIAVVGVGVSVVVDDGKFAAARVALASVAPTPLFVPAAGEVLIGEPVTDESIQKAAEAAKAAAAPISDMRGTAVYRKHLCEVLTRRALKVAAGRAREPD
jgi:carbon-monoxide dehydrogenase medium subunit